VLGDVDLFLYDLKGALEGHEAVKDASLANRADRQPLLDHRREQNPKASLVKKACRMMETG
jgi:hypothetical protein